MSETANVTKVPYLLNVTNDYFGVFFGEAGVTSTIKLYNSAKRNGLFKLQICSVQSKWISAENMVNNDLDALWV